MRTVRSFANEEAELRHFDLKLRDTIKIVIRKATIYGAWMSSNTVSIPIQSQSLMYYFGLWILMHVKHLANRFTYSTAYMYPVSLPKPRVRRIGRVWLGWSLQPH